VRATHTPLSDAEAANALSDAWKAVHQEEPAPALLRHLVAQWALETGHGQSMYNHNFGGIKGAGPSGLTTVCRTREGSGASEREVRDGFRAYGSVREGAVDYVRVLSRRFGAALERAKAGDSRGFARELKSAGYYTGAEEAYARQIELLTGGSGASGSSSRGSSGLPHPAPAGDHLGALMTPLGLDAGRPEMAPSVIDVMRFTDAISRAALRIAGGPNDDEALR
jgi:hypothetical protein